MVRLAYVVMAHSGADQLLRLLTAIGDPGNLYCVHLDRGSSARFHAAVAERLTEPNQVLLRPRRVRWGGFSQVEVELAGMRAALLRGGWDYLINLSGQDYPLASQRRIMTDLAASPSRNYVGCTDQLRDWPESLSRVTRWHLETPWGVKDLRLRRRLPGGLVPFAGSSWFILTREFCEYAVLSPEASRLARFYRYTACPDEGYFQTLLMNSEFRDSVDRDVRRYVRFEPGTSRPVVLTMGDWDELSASGAYFARKFDESVDGAVLDRLDAALASG